MTSPEMIGVHRALALVERSLKSADEMRAVQLETGGNAPELVQGILDGIARLWARSDKVRAEESEAKLVYLLDFYRSAHPGDFEEDGHFTFPDGETFFARKPE